MRRTAIVLDVPEEVILRRHRRRSDRDFGDHVIRRQRAELHRDLKRLRKEGFDRVHILRDPAEIDTAVVEPEQSRVDRRDLTGPFGIVGDVHGCRAELETLLAKLGYAVVHDGRGRPVGAGHPEGRTAVFVGDLVDRGPDTPEVLRLVMGMVEAGDALCVAGDHENGLVRVLRQHGVAAPHGLAGALRRLAAEPAEFRAAALTFCEGLVSHYVLDGGGLVVAHAGLEERYHGRSSGRVRARTLHGRTTGRTDEHCLPVRVPWEREYRGGALVAYGHTPVPHARWVDNTVCLDTGCVFGRALTALRYPERTIVSVPARRPWNPRSRPFPV